MSPVGDHLCVSPFRRLFSRPLDDSATDALIAGRAVPGEQALGDALAVLRSSVEVVEPSAALAAMLAAGVTPMAPAVVRTGGPRRRWALRSVVALAAVSASLLGAASANALPGPLQRAVSGLVKTLTPLELPAPLDGDQAPVVPVAPVEVTVPETHGVLTGDQPGEQESGPEQDGVDAEGNAPDSDSSSDDAPDSGEADSGAPASNGSGDDGAEKEGPAREGAVKEGAPTEGAENEGPAADEPNGDRATDEPDSPDSPDAS